MSGDLRTRVRRIVERDIAAGANTTSLLHADILALLDADPGTPTADAPADADLAESIKRDVQDALFALNAERQDQGWHEGMIPGVIEVSRLVSAALLPLVRAQVEAARRDTLNGAAEALEHEQSPGGDGILHFPTLLREMHVATTAANWLRDRAARGETRQP